MRRWVLFTWAFAAACAVPLPLLAMAMPEIPGLHGPFAEHGRLDADEVSIRIVCDEVGDYADCRTVATYRLRVDDREEVTLGWVADTIRVENGGRVVATEAMDYVDADGSLVSALGPEPGVSAGDFGYRGQLHRATLPVVDGRVDVTVFVDMAPSNWNRSFFSFPALFSRHPFLGQDTSDGSYQMTVSTPVTTSAGAVTIETAVRPGNCEGRVATEATSEASPPRLEVGGPTGAFANVHVACGPPSLAHGGPTLGLVVSRRGNRFRGRAGYEIGLGRTFIATLNADFAQEDVTVTPTIEAALPTMLILPSLAAGIGVPIRVREESAIGLRFETTWALWVLRGGYALDVFFEDDGPQTRSLWLLGASL